MNIYIYIYNDDDDDEWKSQLMCMIGYLRIKRILTRIQANIIECLKNNANILKRALHTSTRIKFENEIKYLMEVEKS